MAHALRAVDIDEQALSDIATLDPVERDRYLKLRSRGFTAEESLSKAREVEDPIDDDPDAVPFTQDHYDRIVMNGALSTFEPGIARLGSKQQTIYIGDIRRFACAKAIGALHVLHSARSHG
jgi:hypothetical protein